MPAGNRTKSGIKQISIHFLLWHLIDNLTSDTGASDSIVCWDSSRCINSLSLALGALPPGTELESSMEAYSYWHALKHKYTAFHKNPLKKITLKISYLTFPVTTIIGQGENIPCFINRVTSWLCHIAKFMLLLWGIAPSVRRLSMQMWEIKQWPIPGCLLFAALPPD